MITIIPFLNKLNDLILNPLILLLFSVSFIYFAYGVVTFIRLEPGDSKKKDALNAIIWGIVGMLVMFSAKGLISFVLNTFGVSNPEVKDYIGL